MLRALAKRSALLIPSIRRLVADRDECHRSVTTLRAALTERYAARSAPSAISAVRAPVLRSQHIDEHARLFANRKEALSFLPTGGRVAEIGVEYGDFSEALLRELKPSLFHGYDIFPHDDLTIVGGMPASERLQGRTHQRYYEDRFAEQIADGTVEVIAGDSRTTLGSVPDGFYDVIYIDANHRYEAVNADSLLATRKLKKDGFLVFNDYIIFDHLAQFEYGVVPVVNRLCVEEGWMIVYLALQEEMFCDICLSRSVP